MPSPDRRRRRWMRFSLWVCLGAICATVLLGMAFDIRQVSSDSMAPALHGGGEGGGVREGVLISRWIYAFRAPRRFDVVVVARDGRLFVKRIAGLPGESLQIVAGDLFIDGSLYRKSDGEWRRVRIPLFDQDRWELEGEKGFWEVDSKGCEDARGRVRIGAAQRPGRLSLRASSPVRSDYRRPDGSWQSGFQGVPDVGVEFSLGRGGQAGELTLELRRARDDASVLRLAWEGDRLTGSVDIEQAAQRVSGTTFKATCGASEVRVAFRDVDRRLRLILNAGGEMLVNWRWDRDEEQPSGGAGAASPRRQEGARIVLRASARGGLLSGLRVFRDLYYEGHEGQKGVRAVHFVGPRAYFVLGDNSRSSLDSRLLGDVAAGELLGEVVAVVSPFSRLRWFR